MSHAVPRGFRLAGVHSGVKRNRAKLDLSLVVSDRPAVAAGVYTQNRVVAASVKHNRARTPSENIRVVVINSGNANACTGEQGDRDAAEMGRVAAEAVGAAEPQALVMSTGIIGELLPMDKITAGIRQAAEVLGDDETSLENAARGILTTDSVHKVAGRELELSGRTIRVAGIAKGAAMIGPNMATMLCLVMTDAPLAAGDAQQALAGVVDETFNCISVDGHMSTNDSVLLVASGAAGGDPLAGDDLAAFRQALLESCTELARAIPADGEGATHLITLDVEGCENVQAARQIARTVANSALVKTAVAGADPNWGRIVSAAGYAGVEFDPSGVDLAINDHWLYRQGVPVEFDEAAVSQSIRENRDTHIVLRFSDGNAKVRFWTTDLTAEYVRLNADYHT
ncbi:MAG: bifunctional glutamate N-acetyltransferase/amino-acid acetyltransferase ArgJ [Planctomycetota bacterium]|nr:MAG: bifunctional glutamate N-acetyltransferase/amino-acid acetyltransferase ArgJ [Planctomycetota bacterium]